MKDKIFGRTEESTKIGKSEIRKGINDELILKWIFLSLKPVTCNLHNLQLATRTNLKCKISNQKYTPLPIQLLVNGFAVVAHGKYSLFGLVNHILPAAKEKLCRWNILGEFFINGMHITRFSFPFLS